MSGKFIATKNMMIIVKPPVIGEVKVLSQPSATDSIKGSPVYSGPLQFTVTNIISPDCGHAAPGTLPLGVIMPTAQTTKAGGQPVIRLGDKVDGLVSTGAQENYGSGPVSCAITFSVEIVDAGQTEVTGS